MLHEPSFSREPDDEPGRGALLCGDAARLLRSLVILLHPQGEPAAATCTAVCPAAAPPGPPSTRTLTT